MAGHKLFSGHTSERSKSRLVSVLLFVLAWTSISSAGTQESSPVIRVDASQRFQTVDGFGVNFNATYFREAQKPMIDLLVKDLGATIFRLDPYGLTNWEEANDNDDPENINWLYYNDRYSIPEFEAAWAAGRYLNTLGVRPYLTLSGLPPQWMLEADASTPKNKTCTHDTKTHLKNSMYSEYAETVVSLAVYARNTAHIDFEYFGPVNETDCFPDEGARIDADEMPALLSVVAKRLQKEGLGDVKMVVAEQAIPANDYIEQILKQPDLMRSVGAFSLHTYDVADLAPHVSAIQGSSFPDVPLWLTEYGDLKDLDQSATNEWKGFSVASTRRVLAALNQGANAALFWDAFDNYHKHYPRFTYYGLIAEHNHSYVPKKRYYAARQLYHFVHPGARRIKVEGPAGMVLTGFLNADDGSVAIVGLQEAGREAMEVALPGYPGSWQVFQTTPRLNCQLTGIAAIKDGKAQIHLEKDSIFTLVLSPPTIPPARQ